MPTEKELEQIRAAMDAAKKAGEDTSSIQAVYDLVTGATPGPEEK